MHRRVLLAAGAIGVLLSGVAWAKDAPVRRGTSAKATSSVITYFSVGATFSSANFAFDSGGTLLSENSSISGSSDVLASPSQSAAADSSISGDAVLLVGNVPSGSDYVCGGPFPPGTACLGYILGTLEPLVWTFSDEVLTSDGVVWQSDTVAPYGTAAITAVPVPPAAVLFAPALIGLLAAARTRRP